MLVQHAATETADLVAVVVRFISRSSRLVLGIYVWDHYPLFLCVGIAEWHRGNEGDATVGSGWRWLRPWTIVYGEILCHLRRVLRSGTLGPDIDSWTAEMHQLHLSLFTDVEVRLTAFCNYKLLLQLRVVTLYITITKVNSAFHPSGVGKSTTGLFGWGSGGWVSCVGWQVTLCEHIWQVTLCNFKIGFFKELYAASARNRLLKL